MFSLGAGLYQEYFSPIQVNVLMVGVQNSGKTTVLERLKVTDFAGAAVVATSMTEHLRSKIFTRSNRDEDYNPPQRRRRQRDNNDVLPPQSRFAWICPPPPKFVMKSLAGLQTTGGNTNAAAAVLSNASDRDLRPTDIIFLDEDDEEETTNLVKSQRAFRRGVSTVNNNSTANSTTIVQSKTPEERFDDDDHDETFEFDLQAGKHMIALEKIRPTIGMNLGKLNIAKAKVHVWDLGGRLVDLWERYYNDADAVLFVWRLSLQQEDDDLEKQRSVFNTVRASVDCPILVLGNLDQKQLPVHCEPDVLYSTETILNNDDTTTLVQFANATTGEGVKSAMEWLVVRAIQARKNQSI